jgi:polysaccharide biosynthesis transport protein
MQELLNSNPNDEINLREFFKTLWAYKLFIASTCAIGIVLGGYYALNADKEFTSTAIFNVDDGNSSSISMGGQLGLLANLAGVSQSAGSSGAISLDRFTGRVFIEHLDEKLNFQADTYFNSYDPDLVEPKWKSIIKRVIGYEESATNIQEVIWQSIVKNYSKRIVLDETPEGIFKIIVTHGIPQRAAEIANSIMDVIISNNRDEKKTDQDKMLTYLSNSLADALSDLEISQSNLKKFALVNSALPLESFAAGSIELNDLRVKLSRTSELQEAVAALLLMLNNKTTDQDDYLLLRQKFPIVDQVEFRRILGQNEIISSWSWPEASSVDTIFDTLSERKSRLQSQIDISQIDAERSRLALQTYAKLEREAKISEATYTVLIEQVKAQSMAAGYRPDKTKIYEYGSIPISPSAPKKTVILIFGAALGLIVGIVLSYLLALKRGIYYSKNSIKTLAQARFSSSIRSIVTLRNKNLDVVNTMLLKNPNSTLRDMAVEIHKSGTTIVVVTSSRAKLTGNDVARALGSYMQSDSLKVAIIDFSSKVKKLHINEKKLSIGSFIVAESAGNVSILRPSDDLAPMELLGQKDFAKNMQSLNSKIDLLFLCADNDDATSLLRACQWQKTFHLTIARTKRTKSATLELMSTLLPIQGLLHD